MPLRQFIAQPQNKIGPVKYRYNDTFSEVENSTRFDAIDWLVGFRDKPAVATGGTGD